MTASTQAGGASARVTTLELFFDLVFVYTITQLTALLANRLTWLTIVQVVLLLTVIMWMYGGFAWLTNAIAPDSRNRRSLILIGMLLLFFWRRRIHRISVSSPL